MDLPHTILIQHPGDQRGSTFKKQQANQTQVRLPPIKRGFNLSSIDNGVNSSFQQINIGDTSKIAQLQQFDIDDQDEDLNDDEEAKDIVIDHGHGGMSQTGDQVSQNSLHRGESEEQFNEENSMRAKRAVKVKKGKKKKGKRLVPA